jgi:hypothetical protein
MVGIVLAVMIGRITFSFGGLLVLSGYHSRLATVKDTLMLEILKVTEN